MNPEGCPGANQIDNVHHRNGVSSRYLGYCEEKKNVELNCCKIKDKTSESR